MGLCDMRGGWLKKAVDEGDEVCAMGANIGLYNFISWGNQVDANELLPDVWRANFPINLEYWDKYPEKLLGSAMNMPKHEGKCIIFVGNGPSLMKAIDMFRERDDRFIICCVNSALQTLLEHDVIPDYVILVDGRNIGVWTIDLDDRCKNIVGLFSPAAQPDAVRQWKGKAYIIPFKLDDADMTKEIQRRWGDDYPPSGGNAFNCAVSLFVKYCHATNFIMVGNELSWIDKYYADGREHHVNTANCVFSTNIYGEQVKTGLGHFEYKLWLENFIKSLYPRYYFLNCSEGIVGVEPDGTIWPHLNHKPLDLAIHDMKMAFDFEKKDYLEQVADIYKELYETGRYGDFNGAHEISGTMHGGYQGIEEYLNPDSPYKWEPFENVLDIGCGLGRAVKIFRDKGYAAFGTDIADLRDIWDENGVGDYCSSCPAHDQPFNDNSFDMVFCTGVLEHVHPDYIEQTLDEIFRVGKRGFYFSIACCDEHPVKNEYDINLHTTIMPPEWWMDKLKARGMDIRYYGVDENSTFIFMYGVKNAKS